MSNNNTKNRLGYIASRIAGLCFCLLLVTTGCSESSPQTVVNKVVSIEQGGYFSHNFRLQRGATVELIVESKYVPIEIFISSYKDAPLAIAGMPVNVWFLASNIYGETKRGHFKKGDYTLVVKHGKDKGFFDSASPAAKANIKLTVQ